MHSTFISAVIFLASGVLAAPHKRSNVIDSTASTRRSGRTDSNVRVSLQNQATESGRQFQFTGLYNEKKWVGSQVFETISISVGEGNPNQALRCKALDPTGAEIVAVRRGNTEITFADGGLGAWTFIEPSAVSKVICDPEFVPAPDEDFEIRVAFSTSDSSTSSSTPETVLSFAGELESPPDGSSGPFEFVELTLGRSLPQDLRCLITDKDGKPIVVLRGGNRDITFADGNAGKWTFEEKSEVANIICDLDFVLGGSA